MNDKLQERKKRFLEAREEAGGFDNLINNLKNRPYRVYFTEDGEIVCFTQEEVSANDDWLTYEFSQDQLEILKERGTSNYRVVKDPMVDNVYTIEIKTQAYTETFVDEFLIEIAEEHANSHADIYCKVNKNQLIIWMDDNTKKLYAGIDPVSATMKGKRILCIYITAKNDPYCLFQQHFVSICDLLKNQHIVLTNNSDFSDHSLYTRKVFDNYLRVYDSN
jgi:hypothetical protein